MQLWRNEMISRSLLAVCLLSASTVGLAACGDDDDPTPGSPGSTSTGASSSSSSSSTSSASGPGGDGPGGSGGTGAWGGAGGTGGAACLTTVPDEYDGAAYDANAATELGIRAQVKAFQDPMKAAELDVTVKPTLVDLTAFYDAGTPSLRDLTTSYYADRVDGWLAEFVAAAGNTWTAAEPPTGPGGIFGVHIYNARGTDLRQLTEKGLFNAAYYVHAQSIAAGTLDAAAIDKLLAIYGAHPTFTGNSAALHPDGTTANPNPDVFIAVYAERRSPKANGGMDPTKPADPAAPGPYFRIKQALITAQAAIAAGCDAERDAAIDAFFADWELTNFATVVFYLYDATAKLTLPEPTTADLDGGLHGYGEAVAFVHGFRTVPAGQRKITDAQIDVMLADLGAPYDGDATSYKLITDTATEVSKLQKVIADIATIYGLSQADLETFKTNY
jgi:hypothetical protein